MYASRSTTPRCSSSAELAGLQRAVQRALDRGLRPLDPALVHLDHRHVHARPRAHLGDARSHQSPAYDAYPHRVSFPWFGVDCGDIRVSGYPLCTAARAALRRSRPPDLGPARVRHRPLQLPLPVLHARRRPALARARRDAQLRGDRAGGARCSRRWASTDVRLTGGEPLVRRDFPRLVAMLARDRGPRGSLAHHQRLPARARRRRARGGRHQPRERVDRLASARPLLPDHPPRLAAAGAARPRGDRRASRGAPDQGERRGACATSPRRRRSRSPSSRARPPSRCASSSSCRSTATTRGRRDRCSPATSCARSSTRVYPLEELPREPHATARVFRFADGSGEIGFINPVSEPFCADCNRIRLTAEGKLRTCLFSLHETDLREPLRAGASRRGARADRPRRGLAQGAEAPRRRAGLPPAAADDVRHRRLTYR